MRQPKQGSKKIAKWCEAGPGVRSRVRRAAKRRVEKRARRAAKKELRG